MQPTDYFLNNFVAHKLSLLTECGSRTYDQHELD